MRHKQNEKKLKTATAVLAVLLVLSLTALAGILIHNRERGKESETVSVPDNQITPKASGDMALDVKYRANLVNIEDFKNVGIAGNGKNMDGISRSLLSQAVGSGSDQKEASLQLYNKQPEDNTPFRVTNMFPGDQETKNFRLQVSHHDKVTVHYHADIRPGYEKLAEVLKVRIVLQTTGEELYNGLMRDMPASLDHVLTASTQTTDELLYVVTAYLDTSVGNAYQNKDLIADFRWWIEGEEAKNLGPAPVTGDSWRVVLWSAAAAAIVILIIVRRRRRADYEN